ncbi:hypothetical protein [Massilia endophytica]|uniref:hypothetical protein n=1 Tax=Massilia endophytica TaxID=2899220 RepID=UPI001E539D15|nr:hypothetical protein [Massilia endophytica]UGQ44978.1 hypothetical protein LSQ66_14345 [Massilia endophytica]
MPRNGSGVFTPFTPGNPVVTNTTISSTAFNNTIDDIATGLTQSISSTGVTTPSANLPMGGFKFTGMGAGTAATDSATLGQAQTQTATFAGTAGGTANALTLTPTPAITAYAIGQYFRFKSGASANTGATTVAISGLAAVTVQVNGAACVGGEIMPNQWYEILLDTAGTCQLKRIGDSAGIKGPDIASAATINLDTAPGDFAHITGTTTITAITLTSGHEYELVFDGVLTLTHNATSLILPGGASITTAAGDRAKFRGDGAGNVRCMYYTKASGTSVISQSPGVIFIASLTPTAAANVDFLSTFTSTYDNYLIQISGVIPASSDVLRARFAIAGSVNSGATYGNDSVTAGTATTGDSFMSVTTASVLANSTGGVCGTLHVHNANSAASAKVLISHTMCMTGTATQAQADTIGSNFVSANAVSGIRFYWSGGANFAAGGSIKIYGVLN